MGSPRDPGRDATRIAILVDINNRWVAVHTSAYLRCVTLPWPSCPCIVPATEGGQAILQTKPTSPTYTESGHRGPTSGTPHTYTHTTPARYAHKPCLVCQTKVESNVCVLPSANVDATPDPVALSSNEGVDVGVEVVFYQLDPGAGAGHGMDMNAGMNKNIDMASFACGVRREE